MRRATVAVAFVAMVAGLAPAASAGNKKRSQPRSRTEVAPAHVGPRGATHDPASLRRQVLVHTATSTPAQAPRATPQPRAAAPGHLRHEMARAPLRPAAPARSRGLGRKVMAMIGVGAAAIGTGVVVAAGFAALGAGAPLAAVIGIPSALILTGAVALISGGMEGSSYGVYQTDPRNVLRAAAVQQRRRQQSFRNNNFPPPGQF